MYSKSSKFPGAIFDLVTTIPHDFELQTKKGMLVKIISMYLNKIVKTIWNQMVIVYICTGENNEGDRLWLHGRSISSISVYTLTLIFKSSSN